MDYETQIKRLIEKLEDEKYLIWNDDDWYELGYNAGVSMTICFIKDYFGGIFE